MSGVASEKGYYQRQGYAPSSGKQQRKQSRKTRNRESKRNPTKPGQVIDGEGVISHLNAHLGYIWSVKHGSVYFHQKDIDARLAKKHDSVNDFLSLGDRVRYRASRQSMINGCIWKASWVSFLESWREGLVDRPSSPENPDGRPLELTRDQGVIANIFVEGHGFVWSEGCGRVYFSREAYCKKYLTDSPAGDASNNNNNNDNLTLSLKQPVCFEAVPQSDHMSSCQWRAVHLYPSPIPVVTPSIRVAVGKINQVFDNCGSIETINQTSRLQVFFTRSDYHHPLSKQVEFGIGQTVEVAFVPQPFHKGFSWRAVCIQEVPKDSIRITSATAAVSSVAAGSPPLRGGRGVSHHPHPDDKPAVAHQHRLQQQQRGSSSSASLSSSPRETKQRWMSYSQAVREAGGSSSNSSRPDEGTESPMVDGGNGMPYPLWCSGAPLDATGCIASSGLMIPVDNVSQRRKDANNNEYGTGGGTVSVSYKAQQRPPVMSGAGTGRRMEQRMTPPANGEAAAHSTKTYPDVERRRSEGGNFGPIALSCLDSALFKDSISEV